MVRYLRLRRRAHPISLEAKTIDPRPGTHSTLGNASANGQSQAEAPIAEPEHDPDLTAPNGAQQRQRAGYPLAGAHPRIAIPDIEVATGDVIIPPDERAEIEAEDPAIAGRVEDISEDRAWLSHKLLNIRTILSFALALGIIVFIFTKLDIDPLKTWQTMI